MALPTNITPLPQGTPTPPPTPGTGSEADNTHEDPYEGLYVRHQKTGQWYVPLPKTELDPDTNTPVLTVEPFDAFQQAGVDAEATRFLAHLQVPVDPMELAEAKRKDRLRRLQEAKNRALAAQQLGGGGGA